MKLIYLLRKIRKEKNISLIQLSKLSGISKSEISYIENNQVHPSIFVMEHIAEALNLDIKDLYKKIK